MTNATAVLKKEITKLVDRLEEIQGQITPLLNEKELESIAKELEEAIQKLGTPNE